MSGLNDSYMHFAVETAYLAGRLTLGYFHTGIRPDMKADDTPVTAADRVAEQLICGRIEKQYPGHAIVGEEFGVTEHARRRVPLVCRPDRWHQVVRARGAALRRADRAGDPGTIEVGAAYSRPSTRWSPRRRARGAGGTAAARMCRM